MFWRIRSALRIAFQRFNRPLISVHSSSWNIEDHAHICYAARILQEDDFKKVCPIANRNNVEIENEDMCDYCPYFGIVEFNTDEKTGKKFVQFILS